AKAVNDYLIINGISGDRLSYKGFGETKPISNNEIPEGRQSNRRTEFVVIK
ncbi:MAG: outer membrane protein OmpA-like peptidoglycan-associated protein, partial [Patescibacteria group bacterium]